MFETVRFITRIIVPRCTAKVQMEVDSRFAFGTLRCFGLLAMLMITGTILSRILSKYDTPVDCL